MDRQTQEVDLIDGQAQHGLAKLGDLWCNFMHTSAMWPIHGHYAAPSAGANIQCPGEFNDPRTELLPARLGFLLPL